MRSTSRSRTSTIKTPDGTADAYFVHPAAGAHAGVVVWPDMLGLRPAFRAMGKRLAESGYSVLVVNPFYRSKKRAGRARRRELRRSEGPRRGPAARAGAERDDAHDRRKSVRRVARYAAGGRQEQEDRHDRLLHGRPDHDAHGGGGARARRRGCFVPWRRRSRRTRPTALTCSCRRSKRNTSSRSPRTTTCATPTRRTYCATRSRKPAARGDRGLQGRDARLVRARRDGLRQGRRRERAGAACWRCSRKRSPDRRRWVSAAAERLRAAGVRADGLSARR